MEGKLLDTLKHYFGYSEFRPHQEAIINASLEGRDVFALLPTGGGKSLCYQLPALLRPGLTVVVSPLISLMKDQVDALTSCGIAATFLNSALGKSESRDRLRGLHRGQYRLLYVAPERLMLAGMLEDLAAWNVNLIAIDEAHCISEWGHDFRPEYRQLATLREHLPNVPVMALTATATERVREDIVRQLNLCAPAIFVASFNRPNLTYRVIQKSKPFDQLLKFVAGHRNQSGIVYCFSRKTADSVAKRLTDAGVSALPYHAGLTAEERNRNQELFQREKVRVIAATVAFGMGINVTGIRFVVHYDLPKNIEGYYQETGRAGRDGLPSECLLLFNAADIAKQTGFIEEKEDLQEREIAREQLRQVVHYAESADCRRVALLRYFGEEWPEENCGGCDNCLEPRETYDGTLPAQKLLSCVYRVWQKSQHGFGLNHVIDVLCGADNVMIRKWRHEELSTYGIGADFSKKEWQVIGRELIRKGLLSQTAEKYSVVELTREGREALAKRTPITLTKTVVAREKRQMKGAVECDEELFERLRDLRKKIANEMDVPVYVVFTDAPLRQMARFYPQTAIEFTQISGVGEQKLRNFGEAFMAEIARYLETNPRRRFDDSANAA